MITCGSLRHAMAQCMSMGHTGRMAHLLQDLIGRCGEAPSSVSSTPVAAHPVDVPLRCVVPGLQEVR